MSNRFEEDLLFYSMTHVARSGINDADRSFAAQMAHAAEDKFFKPRPDQFSRMKQIESRFFLQGASQ